MEENLVDSVVALLSKDGYRIRREVPNMGQSADIVATRGRWVTFIEAKVGHWRRALNQCRAHEQIADYICVAIAAFSLCEEFISTARERGYGIIHCNPARSHCEWVQFPKRNHNIWPPQRQHWSKCLRVVGYVGE
jgi:hypothetical protein